MVFSWDGFTLSLTSPALRPLCRHSIFLVQVCSGVEFGDGTSPGAVCLLHKRKTIQKYFTELSH